jgi:hypothetical protein
MRDKEVRYARALALRAEGWSVNDIAVEVGVARSTAYLWVRHLPFRADSERARHKSQRGRAAAQSHWAVRREEREADRRASRAAGGELVGTLSERELLLVGAAIYWCEGSKAKPWRTQERIIFTNSDPGLILLFLRFLRLMGVPDDTVAFRLYIHENSDAVAAQVWWAERLGVRPDRFLPTSLKRHNAATTRRYVAADYHGCLAVRVRQSRGFYRRIEGLVHGIVGNGGFTSFGTLL